MWIGHICYWVYTLFTKPNSYKMTLYKQGFLDLVLPADTRSSSSPTSADLRIKYPSHRNILIHTNDMAEPAQPLDVKETHTVHCHIECGYRIYSSYNSLGTSYAVDVVSVRKQLDPMSWRGDDKVSPCLTPCTVSKGSMRSIPTLTELQELLNTILN